MRTVQLIHPKLGRRIARVDEPDLGLLTGFHTLYEWVQHATRDNLSLTEMLAHATVEEWISYDDVYHGRSPWRLLPAVDHPNTPSCCLVSGTGLTHCASAENRNAMHSEAIGTLTDSMRMYQMGEKEGKPALGAIGVQPEWFYKGNGTVLRAHGDALECPFYAEGGGEEPELAGLYFIDGEGHPRRIGYAVANEFSDHAMERRNYLYLAPSKLRQAAIGPEAILETLPEKISGCVSIERNGQVIWQQEIATGEENMTHSLANLEYHHFKHPQHRRSGDVHVHFFGADAFSYGADVVVEDGDRMKIEWRGLGRPLINSMHKMEDQQWSPSTVREV